MNINSSAFPHIRSAIVSWATDAYILFTCIIIYLISLSCPPISIRIIRKAENCCTSMQGVMPITSLCAEPFVDISLLPNLIYIGTEWLGLWWWDIHRTSPSTSLQRSDAALAVAGEPFSLSSQLQWQMVAEVTGGTISNPWGGYQRRSWKTENTSFLSVGEALQAYRTKK